MTIESKIVEHLKSAGIKKDDTLLIHSSYKSLGKDIKTPGEIIKALLLVIGNKGNLLFPALSYQFVTADNPVFDINMTKSCVGYLSEYFRVNFAQQRSLHPTHSVSGLGNDISILLGSHYNDNTPCGPNSPFSKIRYFNGKIIMLGCGLLPNTTMHAIEEYIDPDLFCKKELEYKIIDKSLQVKNYKIHDFYGYGQRYDRITNILDQDAIFKTKILNAETYIIETESLWEKASKKIKEIPFYFTDLL